MKLATSAASRCVDHISMAVYFTRGMSIEGWRRAGIFDREMALYSRLAGRLGRICFVTYGTSDDRRHCGDLGSIEVLPNRWSIPPNLYSLLAPWLHRSKLKGISVHKTNQINGGWTALVARTFLGGRLLVRCGFVWSDFVARLGGGALRRVMSSGIERVLLRAADAIIVASEADARQIARRYQVSSDSVTIIGNYVDLARFRPLPEVRRQVGRITFVGRLEEQKNPTSLVEALVGLEHVRLTLVGDGPLRVILQERANQLNLDVEFRGTVEHAELPGLLKRSDAFILPSWFEGTPKALLEAMACGVPVIAARSPGITEIVTHGQTGYLCGHSAGEIGSAIRTVLGDDALRERLGRKGARYVEDHHALASAVARELSLVARLCPIE